MAKAKKEKKKYGEPYARRNLLRRGDIKKVVEATGFSTYSVGLQMNGKRKMHITVLAMLDKLADRSENLINEFEV